MLDLFLGDPVYDENKQVVRRNFGIKNAVAICLTFYALYYFLPKTTILSGMSPKGSKKKGSKGKGSKGKIQKGGGAEAWIGGLLVAAFFIAVSCTESNPPFCVAMITISILIFFGAVLLSHDDKALKEETNQGPISDTRGSE